jgi:hypothetical protein
MIMTDPRKTPQDENEDRAREAERVVRERRQELPSERDTESPESGRPPRDTEWERRGPKRLREY